MTTGPLLAALLDGILAWTAPGGCPTQDHLDAAIEALSGVGPTDALDFPVRARATVAVHNDEFSLEFEIESPTGRTRKRLTAARCETLAEAVALEVSLALEPLRVLDQVRPLPARPRPPPPAASRPPVDAPAAAAPARAKPRAALRVTGGLGLGVLPGIGGGVQFGVGVLGRQWRVDLIGDYWPRRRTLYADASDVGGDVTLGTAMARPCIRPGVGPVHIPVCAGVQLGAIRARGVGNNAPRTAHRLYASVPISAGVSWLAVKRLALVAEVQAPVALVRPGFAVGDLQTLFRVPPVGFRALAGLEVRLP